MSKRAAAGVAMENCYKVVEQAAIDGVRCPSNGTFGVESCYLRELARTGRIRIGICQHNYRVVTILTGPHIGKSTLPHPTLKPWKFVDQNGMRRTPPKTRRSPPSKPRPLGTDYAI